MLRVFRCGLRVGLQEFSVFWNWKTWLGGWVVRVVSDVAVWVLLGALIGSAERMQYLLIGNAVAAGAAASAWVIAASTWDRWDGTYALLVISPSSLVPAIMGRTAVWIGHGAGTSMMAFLILIAMFGLDVPLSGAVWVPPVVVLVTISAYCWAQFLGALVALAPRIRNVMGRMSSIVLMAFCGVSVPVDFWPGWIRLGVRFLPLTHGLEAVRMLLGGGSGPDVLRNVALEALVACGWLVLTFVTMDRLANRGRATGSIEFAR